MKISNVRLEEKEGFLFLEADCKIRHIGTDIVYFKFEKKYRDFIISDASPFAAALLAPSMRMGQDLIIDGNISKKLYRGMQEIMEKMASWNIGLKKIEIQASSVSEDEPSKDGGQASFFSGGVDSFFTYIKHKESGNKVDYLILADGFDICLDNDQLWDQASQMADDISRSEGVDIIKVESNIRKLIEPVEIWDYTHGGCLAALGLSLRGGLNGIFIPSSLAYGQLLPWGSHPEIDPLWSTERVTFDHDGAETRRVDKVRYIANHPLALKNLRVCYINAKGKFNCGVCDKCLRTMINLLSAGKLQEAETFPHAIDIENVKKLRVSGKQNAILHDENLRELEKLGIEPELQSVLRAMLDEFERPHFTAQKALKKTKYCFLEGINEIRQLDFFYNHDRLYNLKQSIVARFDNQKEKADQEEAADVNHA